MPGTAFVAAGVAFAGAIFASRPARAAEPVDERHVAEALPVAS